MMKFPESIWCVPAYLPHVQPPLTEEALLAVETEIGFKLPKEYVDLLRVQNGGGIRWRLYGQVHNTINGIGPNFPELSVPDWDLYRDWLPFDAREGRKLVPFDGDGHWYLCFDYRRNEGSPSITLVDTEGVSEESIAPSFAGYLRLLEPDVEETDFGLTISMDLESLKKHLAKALGMRMEASTDWGSGYPQHRLEIQDEERHLCVWLSPNLVPCGVVGEDHSRYKELKDLMPGMAKRYPGLPEEAWILSVSDGILPEVLAVLENLDVQVQPLEDCHGLS